MSKVAILTDSNSGITQKEGRELGITVIPMPFTIDGEEYLEDINLTQEQFYEKLLGNANVSTSQPSLGLVTSVWDELLEKNDSVVYIPMSSGLSKSCETALNEAKNNYSDKVFVVDNKRISVTQRQSVLDAIGLAEKGYTGKEIHDILMREAMRADIYIMVDTLKYLKKGGRITPAAAAAGSVLKIKPVLRIFGDKLDKHKMMNRTLENAKRIEIDSCKAAIEGFLKETDGRCDNIHYEVAYTGTDRTQAEAFAELIKNEFGCDAVAVYPLSLSVSCHIGPGAIAMAVCKKVPELE